MWSFGHLVICQNRNRISQNPPLYINILYLYIVINDRVPEIDFDQNDLDQMTGFVCLFLILVDIFLKALTIFLMMFGGVRIML